jgi:hypothetical protein
MLGRFDDLSIGVLQVSVMTSSRASPDLDIADWIGGVPMRLADLRGRGVMLETFQMLCPGCVSHGLPLASGCTAPSPSTRSW